MGCGLGKIFKLDNKHIENAPITSFDHGAERERLKNHGDYKIVVENIQDPDFKELYG